MPHGVIHIERSHFLWQERLYERVTVTNWGRSLTVPLRFEFAADFRDMFEVRGSTRSRRGRSREAEAAERSVRFRYEGLDGLVRESAITFSEPPAALTYESADFAFEVAPRAQRSLFLEVGAEPAEPSRERFRAAAARALYAMRSKRAEITRAYAVAWGSRSDLSVVVQAPSGSEVGATRPSDAQAFIAISIVAFVAVGCRTHFIVSKKLTA